LSKLYVCSRVLALCALHLHCHLFSLVLSCRSCTSAPVSLHCHSFLNLFALFIFIVIFSLLFSLVEAVHLSPCPCSVTISLLALVAFFQIVTLLANLYVAYASMRYLSHACSSAPTPVCNSHNTNLLLILFFTLFTLSVSCDKLSYDSHIMHVVPTTHSFPRSKPPRLVSS
jgi:hypothetical protein